MYDAVGSGEASPCARDTPPDARVEQLLRETSSRLEVLVGSLQEGLIFETGARKMLLVNQALCDLFRIPVPPATLIGLDCETSARASAEAFADPAAFLSGIAATLAAHQPVRGAILHLKDGRVLERDFSPVILDGACIGYIWQYRDVTARVRADEALARSAAMLRRAQAVAHVGSWYWSFDARTVEWSAETYRMCGLPEGSPIDEGTFAAMVRPEDRAVLARALEQALHSSAFEVEVQVTVHGEPRWLRSRAEIERDASGRPTGAIGTLQDLTERRRSEELRRDLEQKLHQSQKMEVVGQLAGGIAHDFNNLLTVIRTAGELALGDVAPGSSVEDNLMDVLRASERAAELTGQLLAIGRRQVMKPEAVDPSEVIAASLKMVKRVLGEDLELLFQPHAAGKQVTADRGQLTQVLLNLCTNARDAMPKGGRITVRTEPLLLTDDESRHGATLAAGEWVLLSVEDTGTGITPEVAAHMFEPFFTTKQVGRGTGLGLSVVHGIVRQHGGVIGAETALGRGTRFEIYLPVIRATVEPPKVRPIAAPRGGHERILVVEDEAAVRRLVVSVLRRGGYEVVEAASGAEALRHLAEDARTIDLALLDVVMPGGVSGVDVAEHLAATRPATRVLLASGYNPEALDHRSSRLELLPKPYAPEQVLRAVRHLLDGRPAVAVR